MNNKIKIKISDKLKYLLALIVIVFVLSIGIPTLSRYKHRTSFYEVEQWNGLIATSYRSGSGTTTDPYIISNASEFAFFIENLKSTNYSGTYFKLNNDIVINKGLFSYDGSNITYKYEDKIYNINEYNINKLSMIESFNGHLDGNSYRIYGLYIEGDSDNLSLFNNLNGNISDLYIENSVINGGYYTSGLAINTENSTIKNLLYDGYVIGKNIDKEVIHNLNNVTTNTTIDLSEINILGNIISLSLKGNYVKSENISELKINNNIINEGEFILDLGNIKEDLVIEYSGDGTFELSNLEYSVISDYNATSGLIINSNNTNLENVASYVDVYSKYTSSGLIFNSTNSLVLKNSYNKGNLYGNITVGLINNVNGISNIINCYNASNLNSIESYTLINNINDNAGANITNSFGIDGTYGINYISDNSNITINNSYLTHENYAKTTSKNITFNTTTQANLKNNIFLKNTLSFREYNIELTNDNVWVLSDEEYPILYIDDLTNSIAKINVSMFSWNNLTNDLNTLKFSNKFSFNITSGKELSNIQNIYYYIHNNDSALRKEELESITWNDYIDIITINDVGSYIIYAKIIDNNNNITYINTDILTIDLNESIISVNIKNKTFNTLNEQIETLVIGEEEKVIVSVNEDYTKLSRVSYYISNEILNLSDLETLDNSLWNEYQEFNYDSNIPQIIYFRVKDNKDYYSYINTDYIVLSGYTQSDLTVGRNITSGNNLNINKDSKIKFNLTFNTSFNFINEYKHELISNTKLPENTNITLIDNNTNKTYTYKLTNSDYGFDTNNISIYDLSNFTEVGRGNIENYFNNDDYIGNINENFTLIIDFKNTQVINNLNNINIYMRIVDSSNNIIITTLSNTIKSFNIHSSIDTTSNIELISEYNRTINYNQDYLNEIPFEIKLNHYNDNNITIYDSSYEDMKYGIEVSLYNKTTSSNMNKKYLNNVRFLINNVSYHPNDNGIVNINLNDNLINNLNIETYTNNFEIEDGEYVFKICPYVSLDGNNYNDIDINKCKLIPLIMDGNEIKEYNFDVKMDGNDRVINKNQIHTFNFEILQMSNLDNPNIRVSLYEKRELTAYDQSYNRIDIINYISGNYDLFSESSAYVIKNANYNNEYYNYELLLDTSKLNLNGYKLVFELYDNEELITTSEEKFIIKRGNE